ncbi:MAG TPA: T9SS type A sorting domain-containing protein [Candidatus Kapabacteria bacterium]|nr:T9SS type A sorting domain-containing protein [Candidatus Kapabacteria bacterium]
MKRLLLLALVLAFASTADAQYTRRVLMEEFTNSGCPPCAATDPIMETFEDQHLNDIAVLKYHVSWPDPNDPFYIAQKASDEANSRGQKYYGVSGVPAVFFGGLQNPWPLTDQTLTAALEAVQGTSPFKIDITQQIVGDSVRAIITVTAGPTLPEATDLQLVGVFGERWNPYLGTNGRPYHTSIVRKVMPGVSKTNGQITAAANFTINPNESKSVTYTAKIGATWIREQLMTVAYIQSAGTKEVFQSNWTIPAISTVASEGGVTVVPGIGGQEIILNNTNPTSSVRIKATVNAPSKPENWTVSFDGADANGVVTVDAMSSKTITLNITAPDGQAKGSTSGNVYLNEVDAQGNVIAPLKGAQGYYFGRDNDELIVEAGGAGTAAQAALSDRGVVAGVIDYATLGSNFSTLNQFKHVVYVTGGYQHFTATDGMSEMIRDYVAGGGKVLYSGYAAVGFAFQNEDPDEMDFWNNVFHIDPVNYRYSQANPATNSWGKLYGKVGDPITDGFNTKLTDSLVVRQNLKAFDGNFQATLWNARKDTVGMRAVTGAGKVAAYSFPLELLSEADRNTLVGKTFDWFDAAASVKTSDVATSTKLSNYPNPFNPSTTIEFSITEPSSVTLIVKDMMGREVATLIDFQMHEKGTYSQSFDASELASGTYMYELTAGSTKITEKMILNK